MCKNKYDFEALSQGKSFKGKYADKKLHVRWTDTFSSKMHIMIVCNFTSDNFVFLFWWKTFENHKNKTNNLKTDEGKNKGKKSEQKVNSYITCQLWHPYHTLSR